MPSRRMTVASQPQSGRAWTPRSQALLLTLQTRIRLRTPPQTAPTRPTAAPAPAQRLQGQRPDLAAHRQQLWPTAGQRGAGSSGWAGTCGWRRGFRRRWRRSALPRATCASCLPSQAGALLRFRVWGLWLSQTCPDSFSLNWKQRCLTAGGKHFLSPSYALDVV